MLLINNAIFALMWFAYYENFQSYEFMDIYDNQNIKNQ